VKFYKFISVILHPVVIPTIGCILYFLLLPNVNISSEYKLSLLSLVFISTYLVPVVLLVLLKKLKLIQSFKTETIKERKLPVAVMIVLFYLLGNTLSSTSLFYDIGILFHATSLGLFIIYILFSFNFKTSIHLLSLGVATGFFLVMYNKHSPIFIVYVILFMFMSGILANARLHLNAHTSKEVYTGFILGLITPVATAYFL
jgi:hypothetical protein